MINPISILKSRLALRTKTKIWYHPSYIPELKLTSKYEKYLLRKQKKILASLKKRGLLFPRDLNTPHTASWHTLSLFHTEDYLESTTKEENVSNMIGLDLHSEVFDSFIEAQRRAVQGTIDASVNAINCNTSFNINLGGGLHHASQDSGNGFCVYNDIGVAINYIQKKEKFNKKILIIDLDYHQGNGNLIGFKNNPKVYHYSISGDIWNCIKIDNSKEIELLPGTKDNQYLKRLKRTLPKIIAHVNPSIVYYIAGTDVLKNDFFGQFDLTLKGVLERDTTVLELCKKNNIPLVMTMGGGYGKSTWKATYNIVKYALTGKKSAIKMRKIDKNIDLERIYKSIAAKLDPRFKEGPLSSLKFSMEDLIPSGLSKNSSNMLFGKYSKTKVEYGLRKYGVLKKLKRLGHKNVRLDIIDQGQEQNLCKLYSVINGEEYLIAETLIYIQQLDLERFATKSSDKIKSKNSQTIKLLKIEWLLLQDPTKNFSENHPRLPGQQHPGLNISNEILNMIRLISEKNNLDGVLFCPSYYHIALKTFHDFKYLNPKNEGKFLAIKLFLNDLTIHDILAKTLKNTVISKRSIVESSFILEENRLRDEHNESVLFISEEMVLPISNKTIDYLEGNEYISECVQELNSYDITKWSTI